MRLELARPEVLYLLLLLPVWWAVVWPREGWGVLFARGESAGLLAGRGGAGRTLLLLLPALLRSGAIACVLVALAGPERVEVVEETEQRGKAVGLVLDLSSSMLADDMAGGNSRIEVARAAAARFAGGRPHDELSVTAFAGEALIRVPPTTDERVVAAGVESLDVHLLRDGSDLATGILTAVDRMRRTEREERVVVLLSDGAHNGFRVPLLAAARAAAAVGVRVHGISIPGPPDRPGAAGAPERESRRRAEERRRALEGVAGITGGRYFQAGSARALDSVYRAVDRLEEPEEVVTEREVRHPLRASILLLGLLLLGGEGLLRGSRWGVVP